MSDLTRDTWIEYAILPELNRQGCLDSRVEIIKAPNTLDILLVFHGQVIGALFTGAITWPMQRDRDFNAIAKVIRNFRHEIELYDKRIAAGIQPPQENTP